jgi:two-component system, NtrC family, nitrogen regulation response regulator GlnG
MPRTSAAVRAWSEERLADAPRDLHEQFLAATEPALFAAVLEHTRQNRLAAADVLGIHRATLRKKLKNGD